MTRPLSASQKLGVVLKLSHNDHRGGMNKVESAILAPYFNRIELRHGLTRNMNQSLRSYPVMVEMVRKAVTLLVQTEELYGLTGDVRMTRHQLYKHLLAACDDLVNEVPVTDRMTGVVTFERQPKFTYSVFNQAMSIAKHVGLIAGHGRCGLHPDLLKRLRQMALAA